MFALLILNLLENRKEILQIKQYVGTNECDQIRYFFYFLIRHTDQSDGQ